MTREEEILNKAIAYSETEDNFLEYDDCGYVSDDKEFIEQAFTEGAKWADKTMIEKVCKWVNDIDFDMEYWNCEDGFCKEMFIDAFKKAMEE